MRAEKKQRKLEEHIQAPEKNDKLIHHKGIGQLIMGLFFRIACFMYCLSTATISFSATTQSADVDLAIYVSNYAGSEGRYIYITNNSENADENWYIVSTCPRKPDVAVYISHMPVAMEQYIFVSKTESNADKTVCISNLDDLDEEMLRLLKKSVEREN